MREVIINGIHIKPGQKMRIDINISRLPSHTMIDLPVFVYRAKKDGPSLLLTAGVHGDEINGVETIRRLIANKMLMPKMGTVIAIPLVNIYGFLHNSRSLPDGKDLNRCFPGGSKGSLARQIAHIIMTKIIPNIDFGVDFHTGGSRITNFPQIRSVMNDPVNKELSLAFGAPLLINSGMIDKSFRKEAFKVGKSILVYEGGESMRLDNYAIEEGINGVLRLMNHLGMNEVPVPEQESVILHGSTWIRARISGVLNTLVGYGEEVKKNQPIATISDPYGETKITMKSPVSGFVVGVNNMSVVNAGDALVHLGYKEGKGPRKGAEEAMMD
jgi:uncharacterized protein